MAGLDFLVIGAQKAGTTTLWQLLRQHPQLDLPAAKEAPFFADERLYALGLESYEASYFGHRRPGVMRGSVSPQYMFDSGTLGVSEIAARIARELPEVKLIALLRDPVERAISHHRMSVRRGYERRPVARALRDQLSPGALAAARRPIGGFTPSEAVPRAYANCHYLVAGEYGRILASYRRHFEPGQLLTALSSELEADPGALLARILGFLGVDADWRPTDLGIHRLVGGDQVRVSAEELRALSGLLSGACPSAPIGAFDVALQEWNTLAGPPEDGLPGELQMRLREHYAQDAELLAEHWGLTVPWSAGQPAPAGDGVGISHAAGRSRAPVPSPGSAAGAEEVADAIATAIEAGTGFALVRPRAPEALVVDERHLEVRLDCSPTVGHELLGVDAGTGRQLHDPPLGRILRGRQLAAICPAALVDSVSRLALERSRREPQDQARREEFDVRIAVGLDDVSEVDRAVMALGAQREAYDAVLALGDLPATVACARIARELDVVALDLGLPLARFLRPGYNQRAAQLARTRWELQEYLRRRSAPEPLPRHALEGRLVRSPAGQVFYVERGSARLVEDPALLALFDHEPTLVEAEVLDELPAGAPLAVVHERLTDPFVLLDGHRRAVELGVSLVELDDLALRDVPAADPPLSWRPEG